MKKSQHWQAMIKQWKDSGLTQKQFCADREIKIATLHYWIKKLRTEKVVDSEPSFLPLCSDPAPDSNSIELRFGGAVIHLTITQLPDALLALQHKGLLHAPA